MDGFFATQQTSLRNLIGEASITATVVVILIAVAVRSGPASLKEKLTFLALYVPLLGVIESLIFVGPAPLHEKAAQIIYLVATFGFAFHNFHVAHRAHFVNGMIWGFLTGLLITLTASSWAFRLGDPVIHNHAAFWTANIIFVISWLLICLSVYLKQRKTRCVNVDGSVESSPP